MYWTMATDPQNPMDRLEKIYESGNKRIDQYLDGLRSFYQQQGELSPTAEKIFDEMQREVNQTRTIRNVAIGLVLALGCVAAFLFFKKENQDIKQDNYSFLLEKIKSSNLPLHLAANPNGSLSVVIDQNADLSARELRELEEIQEAVPTLGQINFLGSAKRLSANMELDRDDNVFYRVSPPSSQDIQIGKLQVRWEQGAIGLGRNSSVVEDNPQYELSEPYDYIDNFKSMDFVVRILSYDKGTKSWKFQFGERQGGEIVWDNQHNYQIPKSPNGRIQTRPIIAACQEWKNMYVVAIGIGEWGVGESDVTEIKYAWNVNSFAQKIRLD